MKRERERERERVSASGKPRALPESSEHQRLHLTELIEEELLASARIIYIYMYSCTPKLIKDL